MKLIILKSKLIIILFLSFCFIGFAKDANARDSSGKKFDPKEMILHHVKDAYGMHIATLNATQDNPIHISIPLPVIVYTKKGLTVFSSSAFHHDYHGNEIVEKNGQRFVNLHEKVYVLDPGANEVTLDSGGHAINAHRPKLDLSITRNVFMMWVSIALLFFIFLSAARRYKKVENYVPSGIASFVEPLIVFVRDEIGKPMIGAKKYKPYMPYLLTIFFFIWINNIFGLIPILNGANLSGNIAFTFTLAVLTFIITTFSGNKNYWKHIFWMPGVPVPMKIFLMPIEIIGMFVKPISLMIRLFANITAGHVIILALMSLIFVFKSVAIAPVSVAFSLFITVIEVIVTAIQAYIFTILSALYFGMATEEEHH
ncbi:MAG: ATP synthase F0 subunit A [Flavobacteriaceae bacterium]|nr:ATP synthase F0 subunit A [Flavobacteriaceae bacterium]|tara:strand:- start:282 stop:1388 length:1107 start_codon:yes stop_codon:yes gene_type:complete